MEFLRNLAPHGTFYRDILRPNVASLLLSENVLKIQRTIHKFKRGQQLPLLNIFVSADDVQSFILLQCTLKILEKHQCRVKLHLLPIGLNGWSSPSLEDKYGWISRDAGLFAACYSLEEPHYCSDLQENKRVKTADCEQVNSLLNHLLESDKVNQDIDTVRHALDYLRFLWGKESKLQIPLSPPGDSSQLKENQVLLRKLGYYNPGVIEMEGEWYPPSRLHHLERRLIAEGGKEVSEKELLYGKEQERTTTMCPSLKQPAATSGERTIEVFYSFRSPYSQLVIPRLKKISSKYSCSISIRPMLPMVTRGLPVPPEKERYIIMDSAREARLWGIPFGKIIDPCMLILTLTPYYPAVVHPGRIPFLRALDAFEVASDNGLGIDFVESFGTNQWGNGISAGTDSGLQLMMKQANMTRDHMDQVFETIQKYSPEERFAHWENRTAENRSYLLSRGLWGVPCLKFREVILFGQDKLWAIEKMVSLEDARERGLEVSEEDDRLSQSILKYAGQG